jgi:hypothetical protein
MKGDGNIADGRPIAGPKAAEDDKQDKAYIIMCVTIWHRATPLLDATHY